MVMLDEVCHHLFVGIKRADGPRLILTHEATITLDIGTEDGSEFAFNFVRGHGIPPGRPQEKEHKGRVNKIYFEPLDLEGQLLLLSIKVNEK